MIDAFVTSFRLRNTYKTNGIIYALKSLPLLGKHLPAALYASSGLKTFANVLSILGEIASVFLGKAVYVTLIVFVAIKMKALPADSYVHILILLTFIGGFTNTQMFNPTRDKFYAICIMRMDARKYALVNYFYFLLKIFVGLLPMSILIGALSGASMAVRLLMPIFVIATKLCFTWVYLYRNKKVGQVKNENKLTAFKWGIVFALLAAAFLPPFFGVAFNSTVLYILQALLTIPAIFAVRYILRFDVYKTIYKQLLKPENIALGLSKTSAASIQQAEMQKKIVADLSQSSNKTGYAYFNELFMKRHAKILTRSAKRITLIVFAMLAAAIIACLVNPAIKEQINSMILMFLPYFLFVMYFVNRGGVMTQAMFMNCDHSMLTYRFYRRPKAILTLFVKRLKYIIAVNMVPALIIAIGLPLLLFITGGTAQPLNYVVLFVSIISMSVFFSVHNMVLYYLLQPYNINLEQKSAVYGIVNIITYVICYVAIGKKIPTLIFGTAISVFCVLYIVVALILAYRLAPKTFKLRQ